MTPPPPRSSGRGAGRCRLVPMLVDGLGVPVVAVWISPDADQRIYVIPDQTDGNAVLDWLVTQALPEYVPGALRRARSPQSVDPAWQSRAEMAASQALAELETTYAVQRARLDGELNAAKAGGTHGIHRARQARGSHRG